MSALAYKVSVHFLAVRTLLIVKGRTRRSRGSLPHRSPYLHLTLKIPAGIAHSWGRKGDKRRDGLTHNTAGIYVLLAESCLKVCQTVEGSSSGKVCYGGRCAEKELVWWDSKMHWVGRCDKCDGVLSRKRSLMWTGRLCVKWKGLLTRNDVLGRKERCGMREAAPYTSALVSFSRAFHSAFKKNFCEHFCISRLSPSLQLLI